MSTVDHPQHYNACGPRAEDGTATYEAIKVIEDWGFGFCLGSALKYICRAPHKGKPREDIEKALWYVRRAISHPESVKMRSARTMAAEVVSEAWGLPDVLAHAVSALHEGDVHIAEEVLARYVED